MSLKIGSSPWLMASLRWVSALCALCVLSVQVNAQSQYQSVDGVLIHQEGAGVVSQMEWDPTDEVLLVAWGPDAYLLDRNFNVLQQVSDDQWPWSVSWNPSGAEFLVTTRTGYQIWAWDGQVATLARELAVVNEIVSAYWSNFGTKIATVERLPGEFFAFTVQVIIRSATTGEVLQTSADYFGIPTESAIADQWDWSPTDDRYLYGVGYTVGIREDGLPYVLSDHMVYRIDTETGNVERVGTLGASAYFYSVGLDPTGTYLVATSESGGVQIWSFAESERVAQFPGPTMGLSWRRDGQFLMAGAGAIDITTMQRLGGFEFGPNIVRINSRYNTVASAWDTTLLLQDLTAFDAYEPMPPALETPTPTNTPTLTFTPTPTNTPTLTPTPTSTFTSTPTFTPTPTATPTSTFTSTPTRTPTPTATPIPLPPANTNLLTNPSFASGLAPWQTVNFSAGGVVNGVLEVTQPTTVEYGVVWQSLNTLLPANTPMDFSVALGNSSAVPKRVQVILRTSDWAQAATCEFVLPANSPLTASRLHPLRLIGRYPVTFDMR